MMEDKCKGCGVAQGPSGFQAVNEMATDEMKEADYGIGVVEVNNNQP